MTDTAWEALSNQAVAAAGVVYFLALIAHLVEWSAVVGRSRAVTEVSEVTEVAAESGAARSGAPGTTVVATGGSAVGNGADVTDADEGRDHRIALFGRIGLLMTAVAVMVHFVALVSRGLAADPNRVPWGNMYEFVLAGSFVVAALYVVLYRKLALAWMAPLVVGFVTVMLMLDVLVLYDPVAPLTEALNSPWLVIHVMAAIIATGGFTLGGFTSAVYLAKRKWPNATILTRTPSLPALDRIAYRIHAFAFPVWTFAVLITGPIWAHQAWSAYWSWDPKEVWAFITWVVYAAYLHARATAGWKGRNAALLALLGVATLWFNFIGINYFSSNSQHSYAKQGAHSVVAPLDPAAARSTVL